MSLFLTPDTDEPGIPAQAFECFNKYRMILESDRLGTLGRKLFARANLAKGDRRCKPVVDDLGNRFPCATAADESMELTVGSVTRSMYSMCRAGGRQWSYVKRRKAVTA